MIRRTIYGTLVFIIFMALTMGFDRYFGPEIKNFCMVILPIWTIQVIVENWDKIIKFLKALYGFDKKK